MPCASENRVDIIGVIEVSGDEQPGIFKVLTAGVGGTGGH
jgi:hypothetical protein